jgi:hypothetical protein
MFIIKVYEIIGKKSKSCGYGRRDRTRLRGKATARQRKKGDKEDLGEEGEVFCWRGFWGDCFGFGVFIDGGQKMEAAGLPRLMPKISMEKTMIESNVREKDF